MTGIDAAYLRRQREWCVRTFGPGERTVGVADHIVRELGEVVGTRVVLSSALRASEDGPGTIDASEFVDVVILALDGLWRAGYEPEWIVDAIAAKQARNERRSWPDWRTAAPGQAIEHIRGEFVSAEE